MTLNRQQREFLNHYLGDARGNASEAARLAGYRGNAHVLAVTASRLLTHADIASELAAVLAKHQLTRDEVLENLAEVATTQESMNQMARVKALELLARFHQIIDRAQQPTTQVVIINRERPELYARTDTHAPAAQIPANTHTSTDSIIDGIYTDRHTAITTTETNKQKE